MSELRIVRKKEKKFEIKVLPKLNHAMAVVSFISEEIIHFKTK